MDELPCLLKDNIKSTNNNQKCIILEGDSSSDKPAKIMITGFTFTDEFAIFTFYIIGIYNPTNAN